MRKVDLLHELQAIDTALDQARARLSQIAQQWGRREELNAAVVRRDEAQAALRRWHVEQQDIELEIEKLRTKLKADSDKLYSGRVGNPRELQDLSHEVEQDTRQVSAREDRLLEVFDEVEGAQRAAETTAATHAQIEAAWQKQHAEFAQARRALDAEIARLGEQREGTVAQVDAPSLRLYESLRRSRGGIAVAPVKQRSCMGCRIALPTSEEQKARNSEQLVTCGSCGRILYAVG